MAIRRITKTTWPELKKLLRHDGYLFVVEEVERLWDQIDKMHDMIYELTAKIKDKEDEVYWIKKKGYKNEGE